MRRLDGRRQPATSNGPRQPRPGVVAAALPCLLLLTVALVDLFSPDTYFRFLGPLTVAAPALAASALRVRGVGIVVGFSFATVVVLAAYDDRLPSMTFYGVVSGLCVISATSLLAAHLRVRREDKLTQVRSVAEVVERTVIAPLPEGLGHVRVSAAYVAAQREAHVGSDLYEALTTPFGVRMIVGDVQGKGLPSVEAAAQLLGSFREAAHEEPALPGLVCRLERSMKRFNSRMERDDFSTRFVTAALVEVPDEPVAHVVSCGHPPPLLLSARGATEAEVRSPSLPLGLGDLCAADYVVETLSFRPGETLLLYTDGISEARDSNGAFFPLLERLAARLTDPPASLVQGLARDLDTHTKGRLTDDAAALAARRTSARHGMFTLVPFQGPRPAVIDGSRNGSTPAIHGGFLSTPPVKEHGRLSQDGRLP